MQFFLGLRINSRDADTFSQEIECDLEVLDYLLAINGIQMLGELESWWLEFEFRRQ